MTETPQSPEDETGTAVPEAALPGHEAAPQNPPRVVSELEARVQELTRKVGELEDARLRARAETENVRRRAQEEVEKAKKFGIEKFARELLEVKDSLEAALSYDQQTLEELRCGVELTLKQLVDAFEKSTIREVNPAGEKFDPDFHYAIQTVPSEQEPYTVVRVLRKGYLIAERVLRPAEVIVAQAKDA